LSAPWYGVDPTTRTSWNLGKSTERIEGNFQLANWVNFWVNLRSRQRTSSLIPETLRIA
jgi:hypothetical protein